MKQSNEISNLTKALLKAQSQMGAAAKGSKNPFFKSSYADLPTVMEVVKGPLNENGVIVLQPSTNKEGKNFIETTLIHAETGEYISSDTEVVSATKFDKEGREVVDPQSFGAAQTYARRFGLQAMLFIPAEDDDGNYASGKTNAYGKATTSANVASNSTVTQAKVQSTPTAADPKALAQAAAAPATTNEVALDDAKPFGDTKTVAPLVKSSFRKTPKATTPVVTTPATEGGWDA